MRRLTSIVCAGLLVSACAAEGTVGLNDEGQAQATPAGKARTIYDGLYSLEEMRATLEHPQRPCSVRIDSRLKLHDKFLYLFAKAARCNGAGHSYATVHRVGPLETGVRDRTRPYL